MDLPSSFKQHSVWSLDHHSSSHTVLQHTSCAQVEILVRPQVVRPKSCGLKTGRKRPHRLMARFSSAEKEIVVRKAKDSGQTLHEFIRLSLLGPTYVSSLDPVKRELLRNVSRELGRQGNNLNQIAKRMNVEAVSPEEGNSMLAIIVRSLLAAHASVRRALTDDRGMP